MASTLDRVIAVASGVTGIPLQRLGSHSAIDQDLQIVGGDVADFAEALAAEFGDQVWQWPWQRFAELNEGLSLWFPLMLIWQLLSWPFRGSFSYPSRFERLEMGHIAKVIDAGHWLEP